MYLARYGSLSFGAGSAPSGDYGYLVFGGDSTTNTKIVEKININTETTTNPSSQMTNPLFNAGGCSSTTAGYTLGGYYPSYSSEINKISFSTDTSQQLSTTIAINKAYGNTIQTFGYGLYCSGYTGSIVSDVTGVNFSNDTQYNSAAVLNAVYNAQSVSTTSFGIQVGGYNGSDGVATTRLYEFRTNTNFGSGVNLNATRYSGSSVQNNSKALIGGGFVQSGYSSNIDKINLYTMAYSWSSSTLSDNRQGVCGVSGSNTTDKGILAGGNSSGTKTRTGTKIVLSTETISEISNLLNYIRAGGASFSTAMATDLIPNINVYTFGGTGNSTVIEQIEVSSSTYSLLSSTLTYSMRLGSAINTKSSSFILGGYNTANVNTIIGFEFSGKTTSTISSTLSSAKRDTISVFNSEKGYCMGGVISSGTNQIDSFNFSNNAVSLLSNTLISNMYAGAGMNYLNVRGYYCTDYSGSATFKYIQYSTETASETAVTSLTSRRKSVGTNSNEKGYVYGGETGSASTEIDGINFLTVALNNPSAAISPGRYNLAGGNSNQTGWIMGGYSTSAQKTVERLFYQNDTRASIGNILTYSTYGNVGSSNLGG